MIRGQRNAGFATELKRATSWRCHDTCSTPASCADKKGTFEEEWPKSHEEMCQHHFHVEPGHETGSGCRCTCKGQWAAFRGCLKASYGVFGLEMARPGPDGGVTVPAQSETMNYLSGAIAWDPNQAVPCPPALTWFPPRATHSHPALCMIKESNPSEASFRVVTTNLCVVRANPAARVIARGGGTTWRFERCGGGRAPPSFDRPDHLGDPRPFLFT